jgi:hypothetical protein
MFCLVAKYFLNMIYYKLYTRNLSIKKGKKMKTMIKSFSSGSRRLIMGIIFMLFIPLLLIPACGISISAVLAAEYYDDFESGSRNWELSEGWRLTKAGVFI